MSNGITRQMRRDEERRHVKLKSRVYTFEEMSSVVRVAVQEKELELERTYDFRYSSCLATSLSAPPFNFGKKRVCALLDIFFGQIEALNLKIVTEEQVKQECEKLGVIIDVSEKELTIYLDPSNKSKKAKVVK